MGKLKFTNKVRTETERMMGKPHITKKARTEMERRAEQKAIERARTARWDLDVAAFFFSIMLLVIILMFEGIAIEFVALAAIGGLVMGWLMGWAKGKQRYKHFYEEELSRLEQEMDEAVKTKWEGLKEQILKEIEEDLGKKHG